MPAGDKKASVLNICPLTCVITLSDVSEFLGKQRATNFQLAPRPAPPLPLTGDLQLNWISRFVVTDLI